jgi:TolB-like protein/predicted Ser/Thr protein kinase
MIGKTISHYRILEKLGEGGMGVVYKAHDTKLDREVALKFLPPYLTSDSVEKERFYQEARAAAALTHANIAVVHEIGEHEGQLFIAMEFVEGKTLKEIATEDSLSIKKALDIAIQVCEGLAAAHEKGIVHRDIKSDNVMVMPKGQAKIMDFGLAKVKGASRLTKAGSTIGTAAYMSPEQAQGEEVDHRSDIFSFGVVLYEMLTGKLPFRGEHQAALIYSIVHDEPQPVARFNERVTPEIEHIVAKALAKDGEERYQHADDLLADLRHERKNLEHRGTERLTGAMPAATVPARRWWRSKLMLGVAGVVLLAVLAIILNPFKREGGRREIAGTGEKSIAVLPFVDMSPQHDQDYFCDGMTEELINRLSNIQGLRVPARTSSFIFKGKTAEDIPEIGSKLKVQTVLEGSVRKAGDELRITAQLINVADGYHLWSETYDRKLEDVFAIQDEISAAIVNALKLKLTPQEQQRLSEHPIDNVKAYEAYLKANRQIWRYNEKSLDSAFVYLQGAIDIVGDNAVLYSGMGWAYYQYANLGIRQEEYFKQAEEYGKKALTLDPNVPEALDLLGELSTYKDYPENWREAIGYWQRALNVHPNDVGILYSMNWMYMEIGRLSEANAVVDRIAVLDPLNPPERARGWTYFCGCQFGRALEEFRPLYLADSTSESVTYSYSLALAHNGKLDEALAALDRMGVSSPSTVHILFCLLLKNALLKDKDNALRLLTPDLRKTCWRDLQWSQHVASLLSLAGAHKDALDWLENAVHRGFINYPFLQCDPFLDNIRGEERFKKLMEWAKNEWEHFEVPE